MGDKDSSPDAAPDPAVVQLVVYLADGSQHATVIPSDHPELSKLLASKSADTLAVHQLPLAGGKAALTFSSRHLLGVEVRGRMTSAGAPAVRPSGGNGHDRRMNIEEGHLGGYMKAAVGPVPDSAASRHGDPQTWCPLLWQWLIEEMGVRSMIDIGCGEGHAAGFFRDAGCEVLGVDGSLLARGESVIAGAHVVHDFCEAPFVPDRSFDLAWSCEFVEHVEERFTHNFLATFAAARKYVLMTYAPPGQPGWHHVNCQRREYWLDRLRRLGFVLDETLTAKARKLAGPGHFALHGLFMVRDPPSVPESVAAGRSKRASPAAIDVDPLPVNPMPIARHEGLDFLLFDDIFVHATRPVVTAVCSYYGADWEPSDHGVDYDQVDLVLDGTRIRATCRRHRLDSWEPSMMLEFEHPALERAIGARTHINFAIEVGDHHREFAISTQPPPARDVVMSLVVRDENRWIRTFLEYYLRCLEVSHVYVYDHLTSDRDTLLSILAPYRRRREVTYIPWPFRWRNRADGKMAAQPAQETHSLARFANCRWLGFFDVDELLRLPNTTLPAFLERFSKAAVDGLSFGLRWFSYRGQLEFEEVDDAPLTYLHARRDELGRKRQKLFVKGGETRFLRLHWLEEGRRELPIDDTEIFFHHYEQRPQRFEHGKRAPAELDDYMLRFRDRLSIGRTVPRPTTQAEWIGRIESSIAAAQRCQSKLTSDVLALDGMCGRYTRHFYNNLCDFYDCRLLEIGSYHGASTCAALFRNDVDAVCIDHWRQFHGRRHRFADAVRRFRGRSQVRIIEQGCFTVEAAAIGSFDVYLYDGGHGAADHFRAIANFIPSLADYAVVVVDDWCRPAVQQGTRAAIRDLALDVRYEKEILPPRGETADENRVAGRNGWWNGAFVMLLRNRP